jgi:hypothetical protein
MLLKDCCVKHGGRSGRKPNLATSASRTPVFTAEEMERLDRYMSEDDQSLKREFHVGRILFDRAVEASERSADPQVIQRFLGMIVSLAMVANSRQKRALPPSFVDVESEEFLNTFAHGTRQQLLDSAAGAVRWLVQFFDPDGSGGMFDRLPGDVKRLAEGGVTPAMVDEWGRERQVTLPWAGTR